MHLSTYLGLAHRGEQTLADSYRQVAHGHAAEADVFHICLQLADQCEQHVSRLAPLVEQYGEHPEGEPDRLHAEGLSEARPGGLGLLRDLHDLYLLASYLDIAWTMIGQALKGARNTSALDIVSSCEAETSTQLQWLTTRLKQAAPQALLVAE